jgi:predicted enzyme involved in methoxymalonyl-ACP biosynthesis
VETFLMSCRVIGRTVENAMFEHLRLWLAEHGYLRIRGDYIPSKKNHIVADLLPRMGFTLEDESPDRLSYLRNVKDPVNNLYVAFQEEATRMATR